MKILTSLILSSLFLGTVTYVRAEEGSPKDEFEIAHTRKGNKMLKVVCTERTEEGCQKLRFKAFEPNANGVMVENNIIWNLPREQWQEAGKKIKKYHQIKQGTIPVSGNITSAFFPDGVDSVGGLFGAALVFIVLDVPTQPAQLAVWTVDNIISRGKVRKMVDEIDTLIQTGEAGKSRPISKELYKSLSNAINEAD